MLAFSKSETSLVDRTEGQQNDTISYYRNTYHIISGTINSMS